MTIWYRYAQDPENTPKPKDYPEEPMQSNLKSKDVTPQEIEFAKKIIKLKNYKNVSDEEIEKAISKSKTAHIVLKNVAEILNDVSKTVPFENLKPTFAQFANDVNGASEQYITTILAANFSEVKEEKNKAESVLNIIETATMQNLPDKIDPLIQFIRKQKFDEKEFFYWTNLIGDFLPLAGTPLAQGLLGVVKIMDYKLTWLPKLESDYALFKSGVKQYFSAQNSKEKAAAEKNLKTSLSGLTGVISNILIDTAYFLDGLAGLAAIVATPSAPIIIGIAQTLKLTGFAVQAISTAIDPETPGRIESLTRMLQGLPAGKSNTTEQEYKSLESEIKPFVELYTLYTDPNATEKEKAKNKEKAVNRGIGIVKEKILNDKYYPIVKTLYAEYSKYNTKNWENKYGTDKTSNMEAQPLFVIMNFANDLLGQKYFWLNNPATPEYKNFSSLIRRLLNFSGYNEDVKKEKTAPSKKSLAISSIDLALKSSMTNQFTASLIREMANKYTAGNIYNFLNKKNIEINNLITSEARNANFAARFNVRPGSAGLDSLKVDIMNLKKILNTWK